MRLDQVIRNPVPTLDPVTAIDAARRRKPESVGLANFTAWKYKGALNIMVWIEIEPKKLPNIIAARGFLDNSSTGRTARGTVRSYRSNIIANTTDATKDPITSGCPHGKTFPPKFNPIMSAVTDNTRMNEPVRSTLRSNCKIDIRSAPTCFTPRSAGIVHAAVMK